MHILGISAFYHDSAAALVRDGEIVAAAQEERFTRKKHDSGFPHPRRRVLSRASRAAAHRYRLRGLLRQAVSQIRTAAETYIAYAPRGLRSFQMAMPLWIREKLFQKTLCTTNWRAWPGFDWQQKLLFAEHHLSHAASAFYPVAVRGSADPYYGWRRRMGHHVCCLGTRK